MSAGSDLPEISKADCEALAEFRRAIRRFLRFSQRNFNELRRLREALSPGILHAPPEDV